MRRSSLVYVLGVMGLSLVLALASLARLTAGVALRLFADDGSYWIFSVGQRTELIPFSPARGSVLILTFALVAAALLLYGVHRARLTGWLAEEPAEAGSLHETYLQLICAVLLVALLLAGVLTVVGFIDMLAAPDLPRSTTLYAPVPGSDPPEMQLGAGRARFVVGLANAALFGGAFLFHRRRLQGLSGE
jgi:hypothetical protein